MSAAWTSPWASVCLAPVLSGQRDPCGGSWGAVTCRGCLGSCQGEVAECASPAIRGHAAGHPSGRGSVASARKDSEFEWRLSLATPVVGSVT